RPLGGVLRDDTGGVGEAPAVDARDPGCRRRGGRRGLRRLRLPRPSLRPQQVGADGTGHDGQGHGGREQPDPAAAGRLAAYVRARPELSPADVAFSLAANRSAFESRAVVPGTEGRDGLLAGLDALASREVDGENGVSSSRAVFVFPGQGSQWAGMAVELLDSSPVFAQAITDCETALAPHVDWSLTAVLRDEDNAPGLDRVDVVQPASWAMMIALAALWRAHGINPTAVIGHSQGEIAAAVVAGGLTIQDGARIIALRSKALRTLSGGGGMAWMNVPETQAQDILTTWPGRISIAAVNGPSSTVVAGHPEALDELLTHCDTNGIWARRIPVDYASHSAHVDDIQTTLAHELKDITPQSGHTAFHSTVTGGLLDTNELDAAYWFRNLRSKVRLAEVVDQLAAPGVVFIEVSAHPVLISGIADTLGDNGAVIGTLHRNTGSLDRFIHSAAEAWTHGATIHWPTLLDPYQPHTVELPTYPFQRRHYWLEPEAPSVAPGAPRPAVPTAESASLLGARLPSSPLAQAQFSPPLDPSAHPCLGDFVVGGRPVVSAGVFVESLSWSGSRRASCPACPN
ncbi:acyltransferase domain-containing protein, partial [Streptomyces massasporeus]